MDHATVRMQIISTSACWGTGSLALELADNNINIVNIERGRGTMSAKRSLCTLQSAQAATAVPVAAHIGYRSRLFPCLLRCGDRRMDWSLAKVELTHLPLPAPSLPACPYACIYGGCYGTCAHYP